MKTTKILMYLISFVFVLGITPGAANADLVAYWPFDEGEGDVAYDAIGDNDGQIAAGCTWFTPGKVGAAAIEGTGGAEVNCGNGPTPTTQDLTLAWWMIDNHGSYGTIMDKSVTDSVYGYNILVRSTATEDSPLRFRIGGWQSYGDWGSECRLPVGAYNDGVWVHITCTYDSATDTATIYVNGKLAPNGIYNPKVGGIAGEGGYCDGVNNPDTPLYIRGGEENFDGVLDEVAIWDTALTADEVLAVFNFGVDQPRNPSPADGAKVPPGDVDLSWTNMTSKDPNNPGGPVYVDVWFGTEPNELDPSYDMTKVVTEDPNRTAWTVSAPTEGTYYWQVVNYAYGAAHINEPNAIAGSLWSFIVVDDVPVESVDAGVDMMTWYGQGVPLDATVVDDGKSALTYAWSAEPVDGVTVAFDPGTAVEDPTVTMTKVPYFVPTVVNGGFEADQGGEDYWGSIPGWSTIGRGGNWNPPEEGDNIAYTGGVPEGNMCAWAEKDATLAQVLNETLAVDTTYELTVEVGNSLRYDWCGYKVQLLAGGNLLAEDDDSLTIPVDSWATSTVTHTSGDASDPNIGLPLEIRLLNKGEAIDYAEINFDDVRLLIDGEPAGEYMYAPQPSTVTLTLAVNDEGTPTPVTDSMTIDVYDTACDMARMGEGKDEPLDFDKNCEVGLTDLAILLSTWLDNIELTAAVQK